MEKKTKRIVIVAVITAIALIAAVIGVTAWYNAPTQRINRMLDLGQEYLLAEDYENAIATFDGILAIDPDNSLALQGEVDAYLAWADKVYADGIGNTTEAIAILEEGFSKTANVGLEQRLKEITMSDSSGVGATSDDAEGTLSDTGERAHSQMWNDIVAMEDIVILGKRYGDWTFEELANATGNVEDSQNNGSMEAFERNSDYFFIIENYENGMGEIMQLSGGYANPPYCSLSPLFGTSMPEYLKQYESDDAWDVDIGGSTLTVMDEDNDFIIDVEFLMVPDANGQFAGDPVLEFIRIQRADWDI